MDRTGRARGRSCLGILALTLSVTVLAESVPVSAADPAPAAPVEVIVREVPGAGTAPERQVRALGGTVNRQLGVGGMFLATIPESSTANLRSARGVAGVTPNARVTLSSVDDAPSRTNLGSLRSIARLIRANRYWSAGFTGKGVDVALIDSGVAPVKGLRWPGKVVNGPDLSFESQAKALRYLDTYGHGTHMAGIIAGRDITATKVTLDDKKHFMGIAPGARIVSIKVADAFGTTDVSQVIAAIGWVIAYGRTNGLNMRVLNLSFGTDVHSSYVSDPLAYAVEQAWQAGIFVVVAAGNRNYGDKQLNNPAYDPMVMAVGASARSGTMPRRDDVVASFSSHGKNKRSPDLVAPGKSVLSLRVPNSYIDQKYPTARIGDTPRLFLGSGSSQAAAIVSGAAALIIDQRPSITPDGLKALLVASAIPLAEADPNDQGAGIINLKVAFDKRTPSMAKKPVLSVGGSLTRGSNVLKRDGEALTGDKDVFGRPFGSDVVKRLLSGSAKAKDALLADEGWIGGCFCAKSWSGPAWEGRSWTDADWSGRSWSSDAWKGRSWSGRSWSGRSWSGRSWSSGAWDGRSWSSARWGS